MNSCGSEPRLVRVSLMVNLPEPGTVLISVHNSSFGPKNTRSSTRPRTRMVYGACRSTVTITSLAGIFEILPCSVRSIWPLSPVLVMNSSFPGCPAYSRPQRAIHSLKPSIQPSPPRLSRLMNFGCTTSLIGESQPSRTSPRFTSRMPIPRVGITRKRSLPLSTSMISTPSCLPPCRMRLRMCHLASPR